MGPVNSRIFICSEAVRSFMIKVKSQKTRKVRSLGIFSQKLMGEEQPSTSAIKNVEEYEGTRTID